MLWHLRVSILYFAMREFFLSRLYLNSIETISNNGTQNTRLILCLGSATSKGFNTVPFFVFYNNKTQKRIISTNRSTGERILRFRLCLYWHPKCVSCIGTLLEADTVLSKTHFGFGSPYGSSVGDSLNRTLLYYSKH
jgi:hypothetical protein